ncbi:gamma carbonic anhydrase family protein [Aliikangiella marina]|uniref:Gamma carbonic anhydrase family protein n=1 Tax=Aliikangiella marina TaxID=1712262 RepID=A0A545T534_9GAMM|nr:gamma carbonic anhydrase family protein [Aliikangiella marina]TQV72282.1 gamma carbonic anhydrase family protein [Aliikangiella marina]
MSVRSFENAHPKIGNRVFVDPTALVVGDVEIGADSSIWPMAVVRGDVHSIRIGERTSIQDGSVLHVTHAGPFDPEGHDLFIGNDVTVGHKAMIHGCSIADSCLIGMGSVVMDSAIIHSNVILGANSLVPPGRELEGGFLWVGSPARKIRPLNEEELKFFDYSAKNYVKLKDRYLAG